MCWRSIGSIGHEGMIAIDIPGRENMEVVNIGVDLNGTTATEGKNPPELTEKTLII